MTLTFEGVYQVVSGIFTIGIKPLLWGYGYASRQQ